MQLSIFESNSEAPLENSEQDLQSPQVGHAHKGISRQALILKIPEPPPKPPPYGVCSCGAISAPPGLDSNRCDRCGWQIDFHWFASQPIKKGENHESFHSS